MTRTPVGRDWPHNRLCAGPITRALPQARIICLRRDRLDTHLSNFRRMFALITPYFNDAYDLLDAGAAISSWTG